MANLTTSADIKDDALARAGELTDGTSDLDSQATVYLNRAYRALYMGGTEFDPSINEVWWWMKAEATLILEAVIDSLTVNITNLSTSATFSATPTPSIDSDVTGWYLKVTGHEDVFKISSITAASATLDAVYTGDTDTAAACKLFKLDYDLDSSAIKILAPMVGYQDNQYNIYGMALSQMDREYPLADIHSGIPTRFAQVDENTVRFNKYGSDTDGEVIRVDYDYLTKPSDLADDSNEPLVPLQYRHVLADMVCFFLKSEKEEDSAEAMGLQARSGIRAMARENKMRWGQMGKTAHIYARQRNLTRRRLRTAEKGLYLR